MRSPFRRPCLVRQKSERISVCANGEGGFAEYCIIIMEDARGGDLAHGTVSGEQIKKKLSREGVDITLCPLTNHTLETATMLPANDTIL